MSETATKTHDVLVQKDISLAAGESLQVYTAKVREAGTKFVKQKLNIGTEASVYPIEIFSKSVIFDVYQYGPNIEEGKRARFYAAAYSRKSDGGTFEFSTLTEVERVVGYKPKETAAMVTKAKSELPDAPGWFEVAKSLWQGVL